MVQTKLVRWLMCGVSIALLALMLPAAAFANGGGEETTIRVGGYEVNMVFAEPVKKGENSFHIKILDGMGLPVSNTQVEIIAMPVEETQQHQENMQSGKPAMGGMDGMNSTPAPTVAHSSGISGMGGMEASPTAGVETPETAHPVETLTVMLASGETAGEYAGKIAFSTSGHWMLTAHLNINGEALEADFPVDVTGGSAGGALLAGFVSLNIVLIGAAAITKRKSAVA